jgi:hypothetical protein
MATRQEITNNAVGFKHLDLPGGMTGVFNQQPAQNIVSKKYDLGHCGARVALQAHTTASATIMSAGECGLSGVICQTCLQEIDAIINRSEAELLAEAEEEPGLHGQG